MIPHLTARVPARYAPDLSGLVTTTAQLAAAVGIATFGTAYLSLAPHTGPQAAMHAFTLVTAGFAVAALLAAATAYRSTHQRATAGVAGPAREETATG